MTCIKFYQGLPHNPATNYIDLFSRLNYLQDALAHLEAVRKHQLSKKGTLAMVTSSLQKNIGESSEQKSRMTVTPTELTTYMNTITLQIDVTKFMHNCLADGTLRQSKDTTEKIGTLFDNAATKCKVISKVRCKIKRHCHGKSFIYNLNLDHTLHQDRPSNRFRFLMTFLLQIFTVF